MQIYNSNSKHSNYNNISMGHATDITLGYVMSKRRHLLPESMLRRVGALLIEGNPNPPTLRQLHIDTYAPLAKCKTLAEAREFYPEFAKMQDASDVFRENSSSPNLAEVKKKISLADLSLYMLKRTWADLQGQEDIAKELGVANRQRLGWIKDKIGFVNRDKNYTTLLKASDPVLKAEMSDIAKAVQAEHPEIAQKRNARAIEVWKNNTELKRWKSKQMKQFYRLHPERRKRVSEFFKRVWAKIPDIREQMYNYSQNDVPPELRAVISKRIRGEKLTAVEKQLEKRYFSGFWKKHPEARSRYSEACKEVSAERLLEETRQ